MVVISFCASWHSRTGLRTHWSSLGTLSLRASLLGRREPVQTPAYLNTKHHSLVEIIKKALALKLQTRDKISISGAHWNESLESLDSTDAWYSLELANGGEERSRNSCGAAQRMCRSAVAVEFSASVLPVSPPCFLKPLPLFLWQSCHWLACTDNRAWLWPWQPCLSGKGNLFISTTALEMLGGRLDNSDAVRLQHTFQHGSIQTDVTF